MSTQTVDSVAPGGIVQLNDAPASLDDATFDSLFPSDGTTQVTAPVQPAATPQGTQPASPAPAPALQPAAQPQLGQPFLKGQKSVYNSAEDAIKGIDTKDALIDQLRQRYALTTGVDPITNQPVGPAPAPVVNDDYSSNPTKYLEDLYNAAQKGGPEAYGAVQSKFIMDTLKPLQPVMRQTVRQQAIEAVTADIPDAARIINSPEFQKTLDRVPELKNAIAAAESDHRFYARLPELLKIGVWTSQGVQLPELLKANAAPKPAVVQNSPAPRPTLNTPNPGIPAQTTAPSLKTIDGIRSIIQDAEARGVRLEF